MRDEGAPEPAERVARTIPSPPPTMTLRLLSLLLAVALASGCADDPDRAPADVPSPDPATASQPSTPPADPDAPPAPEVRPGVRLDRILAERSDDAAFLADLRPPRSRRAEPTPNQYVEGQTDTVRTYVYDGLRIEAYEVSGGRTFLRRIDVTSGEYGTASGLAVGETRADIEAILGTPFQEDGEVAAYLTGPEPTPTTVEVEYEPDEDGTERAVAISWIPYLD